jgi:predicted ATPase
VSWGSCHADADAPAFWPWQQIITRYTERRDDDTVLRELGTSASDIIPLVPNLTNRFPEFTRAVGDPPQARLRVFESVTEFLKNIATGQPFLAVVDDLQWIDDASLALLEHIARDSRYSRVLLVAGLRSTDFLENSRLESLLRHGRVIALKGFDRSDVRQLARVVTGRSPSSKLTEFLRDATQGNPLFVEHLARFIDRHEAWNGDPKNLGYPQQIRDAIRGRLAPLPRPTIEMLQLAAVVGTRTSIDVVAKAAQTKVEQALQILEEPISAGMLREVIGSPRDFYFTHSAIRESLYEDLPTSERAGIHRKVAKAMLAFWTKDDEEQVASIAHHFFQAARVGDPRPAVEYSTRAGNHAFRAFAYEEAVSQYRRALVALAIGGEWDDPHDLRRRQHDGGLFPDV